MTDEPNELIQRWTAKRRLTLVISLLKGGNHLCRSGAGAWPHSGRN
ncbi:MAG TPA: hypothetical protein PKK23_05940 [Nitrospirales bacterium]|nr:hypothetical protein [Nitrospirales bacterium]